MLNPTFALIPAVTVKDGKSTVPPGLTESGEQVVPAVEAARYWVEQGAARIEIVNGGGADPQANFAAIQKVIHLLHNRARVDLVAGVHDEASLNRALQLRPTHVVVNTAALADLDFLRKAAQAHGDQLILRVVIGDNGHVSAANSAAEGLDIWQLLPQLNEFIPGYQVLDASRHGHWWGRHKSVLEQFLDSTDRPVTAGSGADSLEGLHELMELVPRGLDGAVVGHALNEGVFSYADAQTAVEARYDPYEWGPAQP